MNQITLPAEVVAEDRRLDDLSKSAQEQLAHLRWHWTLDESNSDRMSFKEYARQVGKGHTAIQRHAHGYAAWTADDTPDRGGNQDILVVSPHSLTDKIELAAVGANKATAAQLIADAEGTNVANVLSNKRVEVREVVKAAEDAAVRRNTSVEDELGRQVELRQKVAASNSSQAEKKRAAKDMRYIEIEGDVSVAIRRLTNTLTLARTVALGDEHVELISDSIAKLRALLGLIDLALTGTVEIDWDAELAKMEARK